MRASPPTHEVSPSAQSTVGDGAAAAQRDAIATTTGKRDALSNGEPSDALSFREVYDRYFAFVWRVAANRGVPTHALDDVAQEVFIVVDRRLAEFEGRSSLRVWIAGIVRRVVADYVRKRGNGRVGDVTLEREPAAANATGEELERKAALELLDTLLARMPDEQREVFVLYEIEGMSGAEIAALTCVNENTVFTRLRAARRVFQKGVAQQRATRGREES